MPSWFNVEPTWSTPPWPSTAELPASTDPGGPGSGRGEGPRRNQAGELRRGDRSGIWHLAELSDRGPCLRRKFTAPTCANYVRVVSELPNSPSIHTILLVMEYTSQARRSWMKHYQETGNVSATCREFGISRDTFYRWLKRYDAARPSRPLQSRSTRPKSKRVTK